jgi:Bromodomain extra-terminal - transcription regulation/Bromodomain
MAVSKRKRGVSHVNVSSPPTTARASCLPSTPKVQNHLHASQHQHPVTAQEHRPENAKRIKRGRTRDELDALRASAPFKAAVSLVDFLVADPAADVFAKPVLEMWSPEDLPGYFDAVPVPMDLGTVMRRTRTLEYILERPSSPNSSTTILDFDDAAFFADVRRVFRNAMAYNDSKSDFYRNARRLLGQADRRFSVRPAIPPPTRRASTSGPSSSPAPKTPITSTPTASTAHHIPARSLSSQAKPLQGAAAASAAAAASRAASFASGGPGQPTTTPAASHRHVPSSARPRTHVVTKHELKKVDKVAAVVAAARDTDRSAAETAAKAHADAAASIAAESAKAAKRARKAASQAASASAVVNGVGAHRGSSGKKSSSKVPVTSSVSSDEHEANAEPTMEPQFAFVSTKGMEKKRGRKSAVVQDLEMKHEQLSKRRKMLLDSAAELEQRKMIPMTFDEKAALCDKVSVLDFVQMKAVVDIIARGMNRQDILNEVEIDMDIDGIDNKVLREIQAFLGNSTIVAAHGTLRSVDEEMTEIETQLVDIRYYKMQ